MRQEVQLQYITYITCYWENLHSDLTLLSFELYILYIVINSLYSSLISFLIENNGLYIFSVSSDVISSFFLQSSWHFIMPPVSPSYCDICGQPFSNICTKICHMRKNNCVKFSVPTRSSSRRPPESCHHGSSSIYSTVCAL